MRTRLVLVAGLLALGLAPHASAQQARVFTAEDVLSVRTFAGGQPVAVTSDARWIAYVLTDVDDEWNIQEPQPTGYVYVQALTDGKPGTP